MDALHPPEAERGGRPLQETEAEQPHAQHGNATHSLDRDAESGAAEDVLDGESSHAINGDAQAEVEGASEVNGHTSETAIPDETPTSLRPAPPPSRKRRQSEASRATPEVKERPSSKGQKRPRAVSPPWNLGKAELTTIKTEDGRRASARHRPTPATSESEGRSRATSQSRPPSPPWKKFAAEGPTTIQVDGRRRSGRANKELGDPAPQPKRVSPRTKKLADKLALEKEHATPKSRPASKAGIKKEEQELMRPPSSAQDRIKSLQEQIAALQPQRSFGDDSPMPASKAGHKRKHSSNEPTPQRSLSSPKAMRKSQRQSEISQSPDVSRPGLKLKLKRAQIPLVPVHPPHPQSIPPSPPRPPRRNLYQVIESYELQEAQAPYSENERGPPSREEFAIRHQKTAEQEAVMRRKLLKAAEPGNPLSVEACSVYRDEQQEPPQQYGHQDHLASHAIYFRGLQKKEETAHRALAKKVAQDCLEEWKRRRGPTEEDLQAEADRVFKLIAKQVVVDMRAKWEMVGQYVEARKREKWEAEQEVKRQERLKKQLEYSEQLVARQRGGVESEMISDAEDSIGDMRSDDNEADGSDNEDDEEESEENMSESESDSSPGAEQEEEEAEGDMDQDALAAYLAQRAAEPPDRARDSLAELLDDPYDGADGESAEDSGDDGAMDVAQSMIVNPTEAGTVDDGPEAARETTTARLQRGAGPAPAPDEDKADGLSDDQSTDMDSEDYDSDEDMSDSNDEGTNGDDEDDEEGADSDDNAHENPLFALFRPEEKRAFGLLTPGTSAVASAEENNADADEEHGRLGAGARRIQEIDGEEADEQTQEPEAQAMEPQDTEMAEVTDASFHTADVGETVENGAMPKPIESIVQASIPGTPTSQSRSDPTSKLIPQPSLLRGDLRSYQHAGLDWLASLYRNHTNGILADEMGLGKTIQTIALLAHLAEHHEVWETHLVIVPTSVILNWVTEFQKFLPGFRVLGYYGTNEERAIKRKGWVNDPHHEQKDKRGYNVIVTSYNIALKDINALRNVKWHYMVLDEAHNIRNFNSQRFQVLIKLRTRARLLLTGTPLQNSLTELWSLLTFLTAGGDEPGHGSLDDFLNHWREPVKEIFERGVQTLSDEASRVVSNLHTSLRPFMLRRLKSDVEKDLPKKTEHTVVCKLSKRQRQLYQDYMGLADTKAKLAHGNAVSAGTVLYSLRRVCNHPDQFDPRPIQTSFAMEQSPLEPFSIKERLVRQLLGVKQDPPERLDVVRNEVVSKYLSSRSKKLSVSATQHLQRQATELEKSLGSSEHDFSTIRGCQAYQRWKQRQNKLRTLRDAIQTSKATVERTPIYGSDLRECLTIRGTRASSGYEVIGQMSIVTRPPALDSKIIPWEFQKGEKAFDKLLSRSTLVQQSLPTQSQYGEEWKDKIVRFAFCTPEATAPTLNLALSPRLQSFIRANNAYSESTPDYAHEARVRNSIVFPDSRLLVYDSGKLQRLTYLLRELQSRGSRSLIFTQMQDTLNILERFLSLIGLPYLRLDGQTSIERRALYAAEFNAKDSKYQVMILSSRAGGVGLNLTGASSVIFYDLDWNPQMDKQCMDRAHRIGQVRDVEVYKLVSERTVEENILRRANQKSLLDQTVIQEGHFTTDYELARPAAEDDEDEQDVTAAIDRFLSGGEKAISKTIESVEDREDVAAAQQARKEVDQDAEEFAERSSKGPSVPPTPGVGGEEDNGGSGLKEGHVDSYMVRFVETVMEGVPFVPPVVRRLDKHGRDPSHRPKRKR